MIWGLSTEERVAINAHKRQWHPYYLWLPRQLEDGRWAWLEAVERRAVYEGYWFEFTWSYRRKLEGW